MLWSVAAVEGIESVLVLLKVVALIVAVGDVSELLSAEVTVLGTVPGLVAVLGTVSDVVTLHCTVGVLDEVLSFVVGKGVDV